MKTLRTYIDTSVAGGCYDDEYREESRKLFEMARSGRIRLLLSPVLADELAAAPTEVQNVLDGMPTEALEVLAISDEADALQSAYLKAGVVSRPHGNDAMHVALATVARADMIVSWNFRHIVHFDKIRQFNAVNLREGYLPLEVRSPREVV